MGGPGNEGIGGGREKAGALEELPAESVLGGGLLEAESLFCILSGPTVGVSGVSDGRKNSSSSGRPCLRPSIAAYVCCGIWGVGSSAMTSGDLFLEKVAGQLAGEKRRGYRVGFAG